MDPHNPINFDNLKDDHSQQPKRFCPPITPMSPAKEKALDEFYEWKDEAKYRLQQDSDDDSDDYPWLSSPIVTAERRGPAPSYPKEPPCWATYEWLPQGSSSSQNRATVEAKKNILLVKQEIAYLNMLTELTKI